MGSTAGAGRGPLPTVKTRDPRLIRASRVSGLSLAFNCDNAFWTPLNHDLVALCVLLWCFTIAYLDQNGQLHLRRIGFVNIGAQLLAYSRSGGSWHISYHPHLKQPVLGLDRPRKCRFFAMKSISNTKWANKRVEWDGLGTDSSCGVSEAAGRADAFNQCFRAPQALSCSYAQGKLRLEHVPRG